MRHLWWLLNIPLSGMVPNVAGLPFVGTVKLFSAFYIYKYRCKLLSMELLSPV